MADPKKPVAAPSPKQYHIEVFYILAGILLLSILLQRLMLYFEYLDISAAGGLWPRILSWFVRFRSAWKVVAPVLSAGGIMAALYSWRKLQEIDREEAMIYGIQPADEFLETPGAKAPQENERWQRVLELANSDNASDWRLAIIEADVMLEDLLRASGYHGEGVGEMLKAVEPSDMLTLDAAWEGHKVRNRIAHAGGDFLLNERETKRVISLFEAVFKESEII